jgi:TolA-binding protein
MAISVAKQATPEASELHPLIAWAAKRQKPLLYAAAGVLLIALVAWYMTESNRRKREQAYASLDQARAAMEAGSYPEASTELQRITRVFSGTDAAYEAVLSLNQVRMLSGQSQLAVDELTAFVASGPPPTYRAQAQAHLGMALENVGNYAEAATAYLAAADPGEPGYRQTDALLAAARCQRLAGDPKAAAETLQNLLARFGDDETPGVIEAKVRLAELTGGRV